MCIRDRCITDRAPSLQSVQKTRTIQSVHGARCNPAWKQISSQQRKALGCHGLYCVKYESSKPAHCEEDKNCVISPWYQPQDQRRCHIIYTRRKVTVVNVILHTCTSSAALIRILNTVLHKLIGRRAGRCMPSFN